jgi:hypothetical protein
MDLFLCRVRFVEHSSKTAAQIIAEIVLGVVPKLWRTCRVAVEEDDGKEITQMMSSAHMRGILQALDPFITVFKQTPALTCILEGLTDNIIHSTEVFIGGSPFKKTMVSLIDTELLQTSYL